MTRKSGLDGGHNPPTAILDKKGTLLFGSGSPFRGLSSYPLDLICYEAGSFEVVRDEVELRTEIERIGRVLGKSFDVDAAITNALVPAPVRARCKYAEYWASQALDVGFLTY